MCWGLGFQHGFFDTQVQCITTPQDGLISIHTAIHLLGSTHHPRQGITPTSPRALSCAPSRNGCALVPLGAGV